ncbi:DUF4326 domain-containing protein [Streptomyces sp. NPDC048281]|uniref:DUF4326 domain-containing protein n=1 Tax=Streptomyces sp. NPDC048281 TaxID=3154715 RepID=UPI00341CE260
MPDHRKAEPTRIRRMRSKGWRAGAAMIVDRSSRYGNPWRVKDNMLTVPDGTTQRLDTPDAARNEASTRYRAWLDGEGPTTYTIGSRTFTRLRILTGLDRLRGRDLACTRPLPRTGTPGNCHATVLLALAADPDRIST